MGRTAVEAPLVGLDQADVGVQADHTWTTPMSVSPPACPGRAQTWPESLGAVQRRWHQEDSVLNTHASCSS